MEIVLQNPFWIAGFIGLFWYISEKHPIRAAQLIVFLLPAYLIRIRASGIFPTNVVEIFVIVFASVVVSKLGLQELQKRIPEKQLMYGMAMFIVGAVIAATVVLVQEASLISEMSENALGALKGFILIPALFVLTVSATKIIWERRSGLLTAYVASAVVVAFSSLVLGLFFDDAITFDGRLTGFYLSPNHLAMYIMPAAAMIVSLGKKSIISIAAFIVLISALLLTQSAGALIGLLLAVGAFLTMRFMKKTQVQKTFKALPVVLIIFGLVFAVAAGSFADRAWEEGTRSSFASRTMIWRAGGELIGRHWAIGIGPGVFQERYLALQETFPPYLEWAVPTPHNAGMAVWLSTGLLGLMGIIVLLWPSRKTKPELLTRIAASVALVAILVYGFVDTPFLKNDLTTLFLLLLIM